MPAPPAHRAAVAALLTVAAAFTLAFAVIVVPPLVTELDGDVVEALAAGFVNPYASGYSLDVLCTWLVLAIWVVRDARVEGVRHGWIAVLLGAVPGVAVGLVAYLLIRWRANAREPG